MRDRILELAIDAATGGLDLLAIRLRDLDDPRWRKVRDMHSQLIKIDWFADDEDGE